MLRIHFTFADLAALHIAERVDLGAEVLFSLHLRHTGDRDVRFRRWLRATRRSPAAAVLSQLYAPALLPAFLAPTVDQDWRATSAGLTRFDPDDCRTAVRNLAGHREVAPLIQALADGDVKAITVVSKALGAYQRTAMEPWLPQLDTIVGGERHEWARLAAAGPANLLQTLHPLLTWRPPVLHVASAVEDDLHLHGRGLLIQPTVFAAGRPWVGHYGSTHLQPVLFVPLRRQPPLGDHEPDSPETLIPLLGRTRATALKLIADEGPCSTGHIARRLDCSPASASLHTSVLRDSGLITTIRTGQSVHHTITDLGTALIRGRTM